jgi:uncharacterized protein YndB with AHSA1/START domain
MCSGSFNKTITINASASKVWVTLTEPQLMKQWMSEIPLEVITDWQVGDSFIIRGTMYKKPFENTGTVIAFEPQRLLEYTHLSSLSKLTDNPENYTKLSFRLTPADDTTELTLIISNFPTETIYKHLAFYWNVTLELLKRFIEKH